MEDIRALVVRHLQMYPGMEITDCIKLLYQNEMGGAHAGMDAGALAEALREELSLPELRSAAPRPFTDIGNGLCRFHLSTANHLPLVDTIARLCLLANANVCGSDKKMIEKLSILPQMAREGALPYDEDSVCLAVDGYVAAGCPPVSHSARFRALYHPHYRVVDHKTALFMDVFTEVDRTVLQKPHVLVGIDGMCAAGKSTLAELLRAVYGCGVVHADDFFLRPGQRSALRLAEPGGNIDYERLAPVAAKAAHSEDFTYQAFDCRTGEMGEWHTVPAGHVTVLEGAYALGPKVGARCDVRVFLSVDALVQRARIAAREADSGMAERFETEWIPLENTYFSAFGVRESCDVVVDTSAM